MIRARIHMMIRAGLMTLLLIFMMPDDGPSAKSKIPEWAQEIVETVGEEPAFYDRHADAENLLDEQIVTFGDKKAPEKLIFRSIIRILTEKGIQHAQDRVFHFDNQSKIASIKAWTLKPDGKVIELRKKDIHETAVSGDPRMYYDTKFKTFGMPEVARGDIIIYEVEKHQMHPVWSTGFSGQWYIQDNIRRLPSYKVRLTLRLAPQWTYRYRTYNIDDQEPVQTEEGSYFWEWTHIQAPEDESGLERIAELRYVCTTEDPKWADRNRDSWDDLAAHYQKLSAGRLVLNDEMKQIVADLTKNSTTDLEKIRAIANYVRENITYIGVEIGVGGYQPRHVQSIFKNKYGDCKDMSSMIVSMLGEAGITAYPALTLTIDNGKIIDPDFPMQTFNHCIAYVPEVAETEDWIGAWPEGARSGRSLWIDATWQNASIEDMPWTIQGTHALVVTPDEGHLVETPILGPEQTLERRVVHAVLNLNGDLSVQGEELFTGYNNIDNKGRLKRGTDKERLEWMQRYVGNRVTRTRLEEFQHSELNDLNEMVRLQYSFTAKRYANTAGDLTFFHPNIMNRRKQNPFTDDERHNTVFYRTTFTEEDSLIFALPSTYAVDDLPEAVDLETEFGTYRTSCSIEGDTFIYKRHLSIKQREIPPEIYSDLRSFYKVVVRSDKAQVVLKRKPVTAQP